MKISAELVQEIVAHAEEDPANEVCGVVAIDGDGNAVRVMRAINLHASPMKFEIEPKELFSLWKQCQELGDLGAIYHSHVRSRPYPSQTDVNFAAKWPGVEWVIVGLTAGEQPEVRSYRIEEGTIEEAPIAAAPG